ncbi:MAG: DUF349 domain-containing protein [Actinobacteria bacterium]|uniref:DUF349 domain-containing protein n=1 Tax=Candidatus Fonsibacter lacus TaxID=2576439 RepID=A0A965LKG1_9PROT|nr:DUF349 domain-containing protein [Candidatus Fonsibacter lacus]
MSESDGLVSAASALIGDPALFGRVADDGNVYVWTKSGEKPVGSYPGKSKEEALAYFVRKFEQLAAEIALTAARIRSGAMVPSDAEQAVNKLREQVATINAVGDLAALAIAVEQIPPIIDEQRAAYAAKKAAAAQERAEQRVATKDAKEKLVAEAEEIAAKDNWKLSGDRLKELLDQWKSLPRIEKAADEELWKRFSAARNGFDRRRRTHFAKLASANDAVASAKELIVTEAEKLASSRDWVNTAKRYSALMQEWKNSGRGSKKSDDALWARFRAAQETFFAAKKTDLEKRESSNASNLTAKEALIVEFEALLPITDFAASRKKFRELLQKWDRIGHVPRDKRDDLDLRLGAVEKEIRALEDEEKRKSDPSAKARANDVVRQLSDAIAGYEAAAAKAEANGDLKKAEAARESAQARRIWLEEAQRSLATFS